MTAYQDAACTQQSVRAHAIAARITSIVESEDGHTIGCLKNKQKITKKSIIGKHQIVG